jgi:hypothetical protein
VGRARGSVIFLHGAARHLANLKNAHVIPALQKINFDGWKDSGCSSARNTAAQALANRGARPFPEEKKN